MLEDNQGEMDESTFQIDETEVRVEVMRSRGAGGQVIAIIISGDMRLVLYSTSTKPNQRCD